LDVRHPKHDKAAVDQVIADAQEMMSSPGFAGEIEIAGV
jgi:hypothetical protein